MSDQSPKPDPDVTWGGLAAVGLEVCVGVGLGYFVGHLIDKRYGWESRGAVVGSMLGLAGGLYLLIKQALNANKD